MFFILVAIALHPEDGLEEDSRKRTSKHFGARTSTEVESKVCVCVCVCVSVRQSFYVRGCSHKSDFAIDVTEAFDFLDSQAMEEFHLTHESSCLMSPVRT